MEWFGFPLWVWGTMALDPLCVMLFGIVMAGVNSR